MDKEVNKLQEIETSFQEADKRVKKAEEDLVFIQGFLEKLPGIIANFEELDVFYFSGDWLKNVDILNKKSEKDFASSGQDTIWNLRTEFYSQKLHFLKLVTDSLYHDYMGSLEE